MGTCTSCQTTTSLPTAKLILQDGRLEEFSYPIKAAYLTNPTTFICDADVMDFDVSVSPVSGDQELQPGEIYFVMPLDKLQRPLMPQEMAALAVRASSALMKCGYRSPPVFFTGEKMPVKKSEISRGRKGGSRCRSGEFRGQLSVIPE